MTSLTIERRWLAAAIAIIAAVAGILLARVTAPRALELQSGTWLPEPRLPPPIALTNHRGEPTTLASLAGAPSLVFFGFTNCPDVCPTTLGLLAALRREDPSAPLRIALVSVDPERDTPTQLARYLAGFDREFIGFTGAPADIEGLTVAYSAAAARHDLPGGDYTMDHSATVYLLDSRARLVAVFTPPLSLERLRADLATLRKRLE